MHDLKKSISKKIEKILRYGIFGYSDTKKKNDIYSNAINTIFQASWSSPVNVFELIELQLSQKNTTDYDNKELLKMILTRYISEYFTQDRITCYLRELTKNKFLDIYHPSSP